MRNAQVVDQRPAIVLTPDEIKNAETDNEHLAQLTGYFRSVKRAGGVASMVDAEPELVERNYSDADGIIIGGGLDINPFLYDEEAHPKTKTASPGHDEFGSQMIAMCLRDRKPLLVICRGLQLLNVTMGGTLHQHLPEAIGETVNHLNDPKKPLLHDIKIDSASRLGGILLNGQNGLRYRRAQVNSYHHQGIDGLGTGLVATSWSADGLIESIEVPDHPFAIGTQWHPESMQTVESSRLFAAFVQAARHYRLHGAAHLEPIRAASAASMG